MVSMCMNPFIFGYNVPLISHAQLVYKRVVGVISKKKTARKALFLFIYIYFMMPMLFVVASLSEFLLCLRSIQFEDVKLLLIYLY